MASDNNHGHLWSLVAYLVVAIAGVVMYIRRRNLQQIKSRGWPMTVFYVMGCSVPMYVCVAAASDLQNTYGSTPCNLLIWSFAAFAVLSTSPYLARAHFLWFRHRWNEEKVRASKDSSKDRLYWFQRNKVTTSLPVQLGQVIGGALVVEVIAVMYSYIGTTDPLPGQSLEYNACLVDTRYLVLVIAGANTVLLLAAVIFFAVNNIAESFYFRTELTVMTVILPLCFTFWGLGVFDVLAVSQESPNSSILIYILLWASLLISVYMPIGISIREASIMSHLTAAQVSQGPGTSDADSDENSPAPLAIVEDRTHTRRESAQRLTDPASTNSPATEKTNDGVLATSVPQPTSYTRWTLSRRLGADFLAKVSTSRLFSIVLVNDVLRAGFQRYCIQSWCIENYLFYRDVIKFRTMTSTYMQAEAMRIADTFLPLESTLAVNLPESIRVEIFRRVQERDITNDLFREAELAVLEFMRNDTFLHWRTTDSFQVAWRDAEIPAAMLTPGKPVSTLSENSVARLISELGSMRSMNLSGSVLPNLNATATGDEHVASAGVPP